MPGKVGRKSEGTSKKKKKSSGSSLYQAVAKKILNESIQAKSGQSITVESWNTGLDFAKELIVEARKIGCLPIMLFEDEDAYVYGVRASPSESLGKMGKHESAVLSNSDAYIFIPGPPIGMYSKSLSQEEKSKSTAYNSSWYEAAEKSRLRGVRLSFGYIGKDYSKLLGKPVNEIVTHQLNAALVDFQEISNSGKKIASSLLDECEAVLSSGKEATLTFKLKKGEASVEDGIVDEADVAKGENMAYIPPGFVAKEVEQASASGKVRIAPSISKLGLVENTILEFKEGKLTGYETSSASSKKILEEILKSTPESSRALSLLTIGLNPKMKSGYGQDRFVQGAVGLGGFGFSCTTQFPRLAVSNSSIVEKGKLLQ